MKENKKVPVSLRQDKVSTMLSTAGLKRIHQGKVRDTYELPGNRLLVRASDRISIFDFVLNASINKKGEVLTALTHFWGTQVLANFCHHLVESGMENIEYANAALDYQKNDPKLKNLPIECCLVVKNMREGLIPFEMIFRHYIGGSIYEEYLKTGKAGGQIIPSNLAKWAYLKNPLFTPSTKEEVGHDINVNADYFYEEMKKIGKAKEAQWAVESLTKAYKAAYDYAKERGVLILDTKFEIALRPSNGIIIIDEFLTPDSSRFVLEEEWKKAMKEKRDPAFLDKEPIREWGRTIETPFTDKDGNKIIGINKLDPENAKHLAFVHSIKVPNEVLENAEKRYLQIFETLTGFELKKYQKKFMRK